MPNEWLAAPKNRSVVSEVYCYAISFRARYNICGANSFIALLHQSSSWCAVAKRRGGGFYLLSNKWCVPVVQNNIATGGICARGAVPIYCEQLVCEKWLEFYRSCSFSVKDNWCFLFQLVPCARTKTFGAFTYLFRSVRCICRPVLTLPLSARG